MQHCQAKTPCELYNKLKRRETCVLAQLRTGMARSNGFLSTIRAAETNLPFRLHVFNLPFSPFFLSG